MNPILAVVPDLFFATKITAVAKTVGVEVGIVALAQLHERCAAAPPALVLLDLHAPGDPPAVVRALKADPRTQGITVIGFYSHVEADLRHDALTAGINEALPRSAFVKRLPGLLAGTDVGTRRRDSPGTDASTTTGTSTDADTHPGTGARRAPRSKSKPKEQPRP